MNKLSEEELDKLAQAVSLVLGGAETLTPERRQPWLQEVVRVLSLVSTDDVEAEIERMLGERP